MKRFVEGEDRRQGALLPHCLDDYVLSMEANDRSGADYGLSLEPAVYPFIRRAASR